MLDLCPLISVVMPVYNGERYLPAAVDSILAQTEQNFEFIAIDDGSTDGSLAKLKRYAAGDPRFRLLSRPNTGLAKALNDGLTLARGKYVARMDVDDISLPRRFELQTAYLEEHPECVAVGCGVLQIDIDDCPLGEIAIKPTHEEIDAELLTGRGLAMPHASAMFSREAVQAIGGYCEAITARWWVGEDLDFLLRLGETGRFANLLEPLYLYRLHPGSMTVSLRTEQSYERRVVMVTEALRRRGLPLENVRKVRRFSQSSRPDDVCARYAQMAAAAGYYRSMRKYLWQLLKSRPADPVTWLRLGRIGGRACLTALRGASASKLNRGAGQSSPHFKPLLDVRPNTSVPDRQRAIQRLE